MGGATIPITIFQVSLLLYPLLTSPINQADTDTESPVTLCLEMFSVNDIKLFIFTYYVHIPLDKMRHRIPTGFKSGLFDGQSKRWT